MGQAANSSTTLPPLCRLAMLLAVVVQVSLLAVARTLEPSTEGLGTHTQLGLPPCFSVAMYASRCPACGMTTSWSLLTRGRWGEAMHANLGGSLLAIIALAYLPPTCYFLFLGRTSHRGWLSLSLAIALFIALASAIGQWAFKLWLE